MSMKKMLAVVAAASLVAVAAPAFANPFSDVPLNHWAYDAVEELSAKGIIDGYPDGTFKGTKAMTRYEIAAVVARALANAGDEDVEQLKALVVEFGPELEALGVKVDGFDARLAKLEKGLSGWKLSGQMRFDYVAYDNDEESGDNRDGFVTSRARLFLERYMDNGLYFYARLHNNKLDRYYMRASDFLGVDGLKVTLGSFCPDYTGEDGFHYDFTFGADSMLTDTTYRGAEVRYSNGPLTIVGMAASNKGAGGSGVYTSNMSDEYYVGRIRYDFNEKFFLSANAYYRGTDESTSDDYKSLTYWVAAGYKFTEGLDLRGFYFMQDNDLIMGEEPEEDEPDAFRIVLDVKQNVLKFTSLWIEYSEYEEGFYMDVASHYWDTTKSDPSDYYATNGDYVLSTDHKDLFIYARQQWTPKIATHLMYEYIEADEVADGTDDESNIYAIGLTYQYTPELMFELTYLDQDGKPGEDDYENKMFRFRTLLNF